MLSRKVALFCILVIFLAVFGPKIFHYHSADPAGDPESGPGRPTSEGPPSRLVVGVLSGRDRRPQRDAIRDTWWPQLEAAGARGVFVVGDSGCPLADRCRLDQHSCERWRPPASAVGSRQSLLLIAGPARRPAAVGITFTVLRAVVARSITVTSSHHQNQLGDVVLESADGQPAATAAVPMTSDVPPLTSESTPVTSVPLSPLLVLPAGFMGRLRLRDPARAAAEDCEQTEVPSPAEMHVTALLTADGRHVRPGLELLCWPVELVYTVHEQAGPATVEDCLRSDLDVTTQAVAEEAESYGDILLTPGPDVYRRLPDKLLHFFGWVAAETSAEWVVKCDDDVVLDVPRIMQDLPPVAEGGVWWGQFRYNWAVDRYGKWAELQYQADVYPPFACGAASLLSADVVRWLADDRDVLTRFQGEDVSLGLWLAGRRVRRVPDTGWACGATDGGRYSRGELSPAALRSVWHCLNSTGSLQSCGGDGR